MSTNWEQKAAKQKAAVELYLGGMSSRAVAKKFGVAYTTVILWVRALGGEVRGHEGTRNSALKLHQEALVLHIVATIQSEGVDFTGDVARFDNRPEIQAILKEAKEEASRRWSEHLRQARAEK